MELAGAAQEIKDHTQEVKNLGYGRGMQKKLNLDVAMWKKYGKGAMGFQCTHFKDIVRHKQWKRWWGNQKPKTKSKNLTLTKIKYNFSPGGRSQGSCGFGPGLVKSWVVRLMHSKP